MKYLLVILVVLTGLWLLRRGQNASRGKNSDASAGARPSSPGTPQPMTRCHHCGLHLPASDAVRGADGDYCSQAHLRDHQNASHA